MIARVTVSTTTMKKEKKKSSIAWWWSIRSPSHSLSENTFRRKEGRNYSLSSIHRLEWIYHHRYKGYLPWELLSWWWYLYSMLELMIVLLVMINYNTRWWCWYSMMMMMMLIQRDAYTINYQHCYSHYYHATLLYFYHSDR